MSNPQSGSGLDPARAVDLLRGLREEAANPRALYHQGEAARTSWHQRVLGVLSGALGRDSELATKMGKNRYGLMMFTDGTPDSAWEDAFVSGVQTALGYVDAAIFELEIVTASRARRDEQPRARGQDSSSQPDKRAVFVVHGRNTAARDAMFAFLRSLDLIPIEWNQAVAATGRPSPYVGEVLSAAFGRAQAVLVLLTPDDEAQLRLQFRDRHEPPHETNLTPQARANVLFEAGMAMAWDENRTVLVELGRCRPFSDIGGRHILKVDNSSQRRQELAQRLQSAGLAVNATGTDWHTEGDFDGAVAETG